MANTKHLGIRDAVAAAYAGLAGGRIRENRNLALPDNVASQIQVYRMQSQPIEPELLHADAPVDWLTEIRTVVKARKAGATTAETVADEIHAACFAAVMADPTLGGLAAYLYTGAVAWDQDEAGDSNVAVLVWDVTVRHRTAGRVIT